MTFPKVRGSDITFSFCQSKLVRDVRESQNVDFRDLERADMDSSVVEHCKDLARVFYRFAFGGVFTQQAGRGSFVSVKHQINEPFSR